MNWITWLRIAQAVHLALLRLLGAHWHWLRRLRP
jgi:hypothetical protein